jgi:hypothetical protein
MLKTKPIINAEGLGCTKLFVRFKALKLPGIFHRAGDSTGAALMIVGYNSYSNMVEISYVNAGGMVLKMVSYPREDVLEVSAEESVCQVTGVDSNS